MAVFLKLDGIEGESTDARHAKEIDVAAWSLGVTNSGSTHSGGGGGAGRATFTDLAVTKLLDKASPALMLAVATGRHLRSGRLTVTSGAGPRTLEYLVVDLEDVLPQPGHAQIDVELEQLDGRRGGSHGDSIPRRAPRET